MASTRTLGFNDKQRARILTIVRRLRAMKAYTGCTNVRVKAGCHNEYFGSFTVTVFRTDCSKYSPRRILTNERYHFYVAKGGSVTLRSLTVRRKVSKTRVARAIGCGIRI